MIGSYIGSPIGGVTNDGLFRLFAGAGACAFVGQSVAFKISASDAAGSVALSGPNTSFLARLTATAGNHNLSGQLVTFAATAAFAVGSYGIVGSAALLMPSFACAAGSVVLTGFDANYQFEIDRGGIGGAIVPHHAGDERRAGPAFTRARYDALVAAADAARAAAKREREHATRRARELKQAADAAARAAIRAHWLKEDALAAAAADKRALNDAQSTLTGARALHVLTRERALTAARNAQAAQDDDDAAIALLLLS